MSPRRVTAGIVLPMVLGAGLILPVVPWSGSSAPVAQEPVSASQVDIPVSGVDEVALRQSDRAWASGEPVVTHAHAEGDQGDEVRANADGIPALATRAMETKQFGLVGLTADEPWDPGTRVLVRVREADGWSEWSALRVLSDHAPDHESPEASGIRFGTEPLLTPSADGVQVRVDTPDGSAPRGIRVVLVDSPVTDADAKLPMPDEAAGASVISTVQAATLGAPQPTIITRAEWGADETRRRASPRYGSEAKVGFIHHTASKNDYTPEQSAQQVRNLYQWFTGGLKYSDIAYNFLLDRFGRLYEGRAGGLDKPVVGGHTAGFNQDTFAVAVMGDFRRFRPDPVAQAAINESLASLMAWKLSLSHRDPNGTSILTSDSGAGTSRYAPGQQATALNIGGHRDIGNTACPGAVLEEQIPTIRAMAASKVGVAMFNPTVVAPVAYGAPEAVMVNASTTAPLAWTMTVRSQCGEVVRTISGQQGANGPLSIGWDKLNDAGQPVPPGAYTVTVTGANGDDGIYPWSGTARIAPTQDSPPDPCGAPSEFVLNGAGYGHGVGMSQWGAFGMAKQGFTAPQIVTHYYSGTTVQPVQDDMDIRVNLLYQVASVKARSQALDAGGGAVEVTVGPTVVLGSPADDFSFSVRDGAVLVQRTTGGQTTDIGTGPSATIRWAGTRTPGSAAGAATLLNLVGPGTSLDSAGHRYRYGTIDIVPVSTSKGVKLNAVNNVRVHDEYLYGISEVSSSWPDAAQQAQVLAARTYALSKIDKGVRQACSCHLDDGAGPYYDQNFTGWAKASGPKGDAWVRNVAATFASDTTANAILHNGKAISAFYSASSGGATQAVKDEWGGDLPYAVSVPDPYMQVEENPNRAWSVTVPQAKMAKAFGVDQVWKVDVTERHASGAAKTLVATRADGTTATRTGSQIRSALGLKSTYITGISGGSVVEAPVTTVPAPAPPAVVPAPEAPPVPESTVKSRTVSLLSPTAVTVTKGQKYTVVGIVRPAKADLNTWRQVNVNGEWKTLQKGETTAKGRYRFVIPKAKGEGTLTYRVLIVRKKTVVGVSPEFAVTVQPRA